MSCFLSPSTPPTEKRKKKNTPPSRCSHRVLALGVVLGVPQSALFPVHNLLTHAIPLSTFSFHKPPAQFPLTKLSVHSPCNPQTPSFFQLLSPLSVHENLSTIPFRHTLGTLSLHNKRLASIPPQRTRSPPPWYHRTPNSVPETLARGHRLTVD
eukprot:772229-Rhodomonas_salina.4